MFSTAAYIVPSLLFLILPTIAHPQPARQLDAELEGHNTTPMELGFRQETPKTKCVYSCPPQDGAKRGLIRKVDALGYEHAYSVFECVYAAPEAHGDAHTCWYYKSSGAPALSSKVISCPAQAPSCIKPPPAMSYTSSASNPPTQYHKLPHAKPLFSKQDDKIPETPSWVETGRYLLYLKENPGQ